MYEADRNAPGPFVDRTLAPVASDHCTRTDQGDQLIEDRSPALVEPHLGMPGGTALVGEATEDLVVEISNVRR